jgi:signal transduction histidine kinase
MSAALGEGEARRISARRDVAVVVVVSILATIACARFNVSEALMTWTRPLERLQLDELPGVLLAIAVSLVWFSSRRYFEARRQLQLRKTAEARVTEVLAQNQRLAQQYVDVQERERKALARDLHDELGQYLNAIKLDAVAIRDTSEGHGAARDVARAMIANIDRVYGVVTGLIRQLRPVGLDDLGVAAALEHCVNEWRSRLAATIIDMTIAGNLDAMDETRALVLYRLVQEAMTNIARHAKATAVDIRIARANNPGCGQCIEVLIADNGSGADMSLPKAGLGLVGMRERVSALGGSISVASQPGLGFKVSASLPV